MIIENESNSTLDELEHGDVFRFVNGGSVGIPYFICCDLICSLDGADYFKREITKNAKVAYYPDAKVILGDPA